jgi:VIT1/CCC1 family predicted Fe2+/Mn2+ transporter
MRLSGSALRKDPDGHRLSEFIYGVVTGLVAVVGIDVGHSSSWLDAVLVVLAGATAIWIAHAYSTLMSRRILSGVRATSRDLFAALRDSWPVVSAGFVLVLPILGVAFGLYSLEDALIVSSGVAVLLLALIGAAAGAVTNESWPRRVVLVLFSAGLGLCVVALELAVGHR